MTVTDVINYYDSSENNYEELLIEENDNDVMEDSNMDYNDDNQLERAGEAQEAGGASASAPTALSGKSETTMTLVQVYFAKEELRKHAVTVVLTTATRG